MCIIQVGIFFPITDVTNVLETLLKEKYYLEFVQPIGPMVDYFEGNWVGRPTRIQERINPTFEILTRGNAMKQRKYNYQKLIILLKVTNY